MTGKVFRQGQLVRDRVGGTRWGDGVSLSNVGAVQRLLGCLLFPHHGLGSLLLPCSCRHGWQGRTANPGTGWLLLNTAGQKDGSMWREGVALDRCH